MNNGYINLTEEHLNKPIFRIIPFERFIEILVNKKLVLSNPRLWDDPFENFLFRNELKSEYGPINFSVIRNNMFGQCWTFNYNTDFMWRVYAPNKNGIRIKTNIHKLLTHFQDQLDNRIDKLYIGRVKYFKKAEIINAFSNFHVSNIFADTSYKSLASTLLIKRTEFKPEREVRLVLYHNLANIVGPNIISFEIDPNTLFENLMLDPRLSDNQYGALKTAILNLGYKNRIYKSSLYSEPKIKLQL